MSTLEFRLPAAEPEARLRETSKQRTRHVFGFPNTAQASMTGQERFPGMARKHMDAIRKVVRQIEDAKLQLGDRMLEAQESGETVVNICKVAELRRTRVYELINAAKRTPAGLAGRRAWPCRRSVEPRWRGPSPTP